MTLSQVAAHLISDLILEKDNPYEELYSCHYFSMSFAMKYKDKMWKNTKRGMITNRFFRRTNRFVRKTRWDDYES